MPLISLEPEFIVDPLGKIHTGVLILEGEKIKGIQNVCPPSATRVRLPNKMLLPGFVNVHSHALQRALRGRVEQRSPNTLDDFWSWRTNMYRDANLASLDDIEAMASLAYLEMVCGGYIAVGEFNYLHHQENGLPYPAPTAISERLVKAAARVGIRQTLLTCAYERKNYKESLSPSQKRFGFSHASDFLNHVKTIQRSIHSPLLTHGIAIHSTRACSEAYIREICDAEVTKMGPLHLHASEQTVEVEEAIAEYGLSPIEALQNFGALKHRPTLIHATHLSPVDIELIAQTGSIVGLCPSTERNLGDGMCKVLELRNKRVPLAIGTDQHVRLDAVNELRDLEEQERLRLRRRCILAEPGHSIAESLIEIGTYNGRRSLGLSTSNDWASEPADLVAIELKDSYQAAGPLVAINDWLVSGSHHDVTDVFINGNAIVTDRIPKANVSEIREQARHALKRLIGN